MLVETKSFQLLLYQITSLIALPDSVVGAWLSGLTLLAVCTFCVTRGCRSHKVVAGDVAILMYVAWQFLHVGPGSGHFNTIPSLVPSISALCFYFVVRVSPGGQPVQDGILRLIVCFATSVAAVDLVLIYVGLQGATLFPCHDLSAVRGSLPMAGGPTRNDALMLVLGCLPWCGGCAFSASDRSVFWSTLSLATAASLTVILILSYSRSVYLALAVFGGTCCSPFVRKSLRAYRASLIVALPLFCVLLGVTTEHAGVWHAIRQTAWGQSTVSQQRSTFGRLAIWRELLADIEAHPIVGGGGFMDGLRGLERMRRTTLPFTARAYNTALQVTVSNGLPALLSYAAFLISPLVSVCRQLLSSKSLAPPSALPLLLTAGVTAMLVRDLSYSSLALNGATMCLAWIMVGLINNGMTEGEREGADR